MANFCLSTTFDLWISRV